ETFELIKADRMNEPPRHFIIRGPRGMGKTTLLLRLFHAVNEDKELAQFLVPIIFDEEQYGIRTLFKLWEEIALYLEEKYQTLFFDLYDEMMAHMEEENYEEKCYGILKARLLEKGAKLVLFIDNFADLWGKFSREEHRQLEEILMLGSEIRLVAASAEVLELPFFDLLQLAGLDREETMELLLQLGRTYQIDSVQTMVRKNPGRVEALRRLTGGIPRTLILLFEIFPDGDGGDFFHDLEIVLDRVTPLYKHLMDALPPRRQEIVDTIALNWDALGADEISKKTRIPGEPLAGQLDKLVKSGIINETATAASGNLYQLNDRFFNTWYLMRNGRKREKQKILWLVKFLENWCNKEELSHLAEQHIQALKTGNVFEKQAFYITEALVASDLPTGIRDEMLENAKDFLTHKESAFAGQLSPSYYLLFSEAVALYRDREYRTALEKFLEIENKDETVCRWLGFLYHRKFNDFENAEKYYLMAAAKNDIKAMGGLALLYLLEKTKKNEALDLSRRAFDSHADVYTAGIHAIMLLWHKNIEESIRMLDLFMQNQGPLKMGEFFESLLMFLTAQKQYHHVLALFNENKFDIKERFKPVYYALMVFMKDTYPDEYKKMGAEITQTVEEIVRLIERMALDYA
ncbi:MAG: hypothetical protein GY950_04565, partial [bacterium]|nr:hypothetical protein [bacterium]